MGKALYYLVITLPKKHPFIVLAVGVAGVSPLVTLILLESVFNLRLGHTFYRMLIILGFLSLLSLVIIGSSLSTLIQRGNRLASLVTGVGLLLAGAAGGVALVLNFPTLVRLVEGTIVGFIPGVILFPFLALTVPLLVAIGGIHLIECSRYSVWKVFGVVALGAAVVVVCALKWNAREGTTAPLPRLVYVGRESHVSDRLMMPILAELKQEYAGSLRVECHDTNKDPNAAVEFRITAVPTLIFLDVSGSELFRNAGFLSKEDILARWEEAGVELDEAE